MNDQPPAKQNAEQAAPSSAPVEGIKPSDPKPAEPPTRDDFAKVSQEMTGFEKSTLRWARIAVLLSALAAAFVCAQWWEMHEGGRDTHDLAVAAGQQATQTTNLATAAGNQATWTERLAGHMGDQATDTKTIAEQAVVQANANKKLAQNAVDSLTNTKQSFRDDRRAWVGVQGVDNSKGFTETDPWQVQVVFFNSGRTPARNVQSSGMYITSPTAISGPLPEQISRLTFRPAQSIAPQGTFRENFGMAVGAQGATSSQISGQQILISQYMQIKSKNLFLYYFGVLKYDDASGNSHETQFCIYLSNPDTKESGICDSFNDLN